MVELERRSAARFGGEEYIIPLLGVDKDDALVIAERVRKNIAAIDIGHAERLGNGDGNKKPYHLPSNQIQTSVGVATFPSDATTQSELLANTDAALYAAKDGGRNRVVVYQPNIAITD